MYKKLLDLFFDAKVDTPDVWQQATKCYLESGKIDSIQATECFNELVQSSLQNEKEAISFFKKAFLYAIFHDFSFAEKETLLTKIKTVSKRFPLPLCKGMESLIFQEDSFSTIKKSSKKIYLNHSDHSPKNYPSLLDISSLALLTFFTFIYASKKNEKTLFLDAKENFAWIDHFFDSRNFPLACLWNESHEVDMSQKLCSIYLLYHLLESWQCVLPGSLKSQDLLSHIVNTKKVPEPFFLVVAKWVANLPKTELIFDREKFSPHLMMDKETGVVFLSQDDFTSAISYSGVQSSILEMHCQDIQIVSVGPQNFPLKEISSFGNFRPLFQTESFSDVEFAPTKEGLLTKGWIRLTQSSELGSYGSKLWLMMTSQLSLNHLSLTFSSETCFKEPAFMISLFVKAKSCLVEETSLLPGTLDRFSGSPPQKLSFRGKETSLEIVFKQCSTIHVIPLSGEQFFWEANFLLGCEPSFKNHSVEIELKKMNS